MPSGAGGNQRRTSRSKLKRKIFDHLLAEFISKKDAFLSLTYKDNIQEEDKDIVFKEIQKHLKQQGSNGIYTSRTNDEEKRQSSMS